MAFIQKSAGATTSGVTSQTATLTGVTAGNTLVFWTGGNAYSPAPSSTNVPADSQSQTWVAVQASEFLATNAVGMVYYLTNALAGTHTATLTVGTGCFGSCGMFEISPVSGVDIIATPVASTGTVISTITANNMTTTGASDGILAFMVWNTLTNSVTTNTITDPPTGFTSLFAEQRTSAQNGLEFAYKDNVSAGVQTGPTWSWNSTGSSTSESWLAVQLAFTFAAATAPSIGARVGIKGPKFQNSGRPTGDTSYSGSVAVTTITEIVGAYSWTGTTSATTQLINSDGGATVYSWAGRTATTNQVIAETIGAYSWTGTTSTTTELINQVVGTYSWAGTTSAITQLIAASIGSYTWAGVTATTSQLINSDGGATAYKWAGTTSNLGVGPTNISGAVGAFSWAGTTSTTNSVFNSVVGAYTWVGTTSTTNQLINHGIGSYSWVGTTSATTQNISSTTGAYTWSGTTGILPGGIAGQVGSYTWSGTTSQVPILVNGVVGLVTWTGTLTGFSKSYSPSGGIVFSGTAPIRAGRQITPTGGVVLSGTNAFIINHVEIPTGGIIFSGSAPISFIPAGGVAISTRLPLTGAGAT
jgi:hypothetical protein